MTEQSVVGVYATMADAEDAVATLDRAGFPLTRVSIVTRDLQSERDFHGSVAPGDAAAPGAGVGAALGGLFGVLLGAAFLWAPVTGPVFTAGPLAAMLLGVLAGGVLGAAGGGLLGAAVGWGVSGDDVLEYEQHLRAGRYLVMAHGNAEEVAWADDLLRQEDQATKLTLHGAVATAA